MKILISILFFSLTSTAEIQLMGVGAETACLASKQKIHCKGRLEQSFSGFTDISKIDIGYTGVCVLDEGNLFCMGATGSTSPILNVPEIDAGKKVKDFDLGGEFGCLIQTDGKVKCWGANRDNSTRVPADLNPMDGISTGSRHVCAYNKDEIRCWGRNRSRQTNVPTDISNIKKVVAGFSFTCAVYQVENEEQVKCWGRSGEGQLNVKEYEKPLKSIDSANNSTCLVDNQDEVICWGNNFSNQVGGAPEDFKAKQLFANIESYCAYDESYNLKCWGRNYSSHFDIFQIKKNDIQDAWLTYNGSLCALDSNRFFCWGRRDNSLNLNTLFKDTEIFNNPSNIQFGLDFFCYQKESDVECFGVNRNNVLDLPVKVNSLTSLSIGYESICHKDDETLKITCWGRGDEGQTMIPLDLEGVTKLASGVLYHCAIDQYGPICWGDNQFGQSNVPRKLLGLTNGEFVLGRTAACFKNLDTKEFTCWGRQEEYLEDFFNIYTHGEQFQIGLNHACLLENKKIICWGNNSNGQLSIPKNLSPVKKLMVGNQVTCAHLENKNLECWGASSNLVTNIPQF